jgi:hypothetical protein
MCLRRWILLNYTWNEFGKSNYTSHSRNPLLPLTWPVSEVSVLVSSPLRDSWPDSCSYGIFCFCILFRSVVSAEMTIFSPHFYFFNNVYFIFFVLNYNSLCLSQAVWCAATMPRQFRHWNDRMLDRHQLCLLCFRCRASPFPMLRTFLFSWFWMTSACFLHIFVIKSYTYGTWSSACISRVGVRLVSQPTSYSEYFVLQSLKFH